MSIYRPCDRCAWPREVGERSGLCPACRSYLRTLRRSIVNADRAPRIEWQRPDGTTYFRLSVRGPKVSATQRQEWARWAWALERGAA